MKQKYYYVGLLLVTMILVLISFSSCSTYGKSCEGNRKMLTAGPGKTKFNK